MDRVTVFLNEKYRLKACCCFSLKIGTNIIGILEIISNIIMMFTIHFEFMVVENENSVVAVIRGESDVTRMIVDICRTVLIVFAAAMVWGNIKGNKIPMMPYVYAKFAALIVAIMAGVLLTLAYFFLARFTDGLVTLIIAIIAISLGLYFWQIVQCRIMELEETVRPETLFTHGDPGIPAYGNVRDNLVQAAGGPPMVPFFNDPIILSPIVTPIRH